ncbi:MAG: DUF1345 domain-containing protein [Rhodospirillaceae bacterium]
MPGSWSIPLRAVVGWDVAILVHLGMVLVMMATSGHQQMRQHAAVENEERLALLAVTTVAALASLFAIGELLSGDRDLPMGERTVHFALGGVTILLSWLFVHALYAVHCAHDHYRALHRGGAPAGLEFPGTPEPDYWDFCYFAYTVGMTAQTSDVAVRGSGLRRLTLVHEIVSFCFNTVLLALTVGIASNLL